MELPINLKHFRLEISKAIRMKSSDLAINCYSIINKETGVTEAEGQTLAASFDKAVNMDCALEYTHLYLAAHPMADLEHLEGIVLRDEHLVERTELAGLKKPELLN